MQLNMNWYIHWKIHRIILKFKKIQNDDETKYTTFYCNSKAEAIVNETDTDDICESIFTTIISND